MNSIFLDPSDEFLTQVVNIGINIGIPNKFLASAFTFQNEATKFELPGKEYLLHGGCQCSDQLPRHGRGWQEYKKLAKVSID